MDHALLFSIYEKLVPLPSTHILFAEDFNPILDPVLVSSNSLRAASLDLTQCADTCAVTELRRWKHADSKVFSHLSTVHKSGSRIDLAFGSSQVLPKISGASYLPGGLSDHSPLELCLWLGRRKDPGTWRLAPRWIQNKSVAKLISPQIDLYWSHNMITVSTEMMWDAFKATIRGCYISAIKATRTDCNSETLRYERSWRFCLICRAPQTS